MNKCIILEIYRNTVTFAAYNEMWGDQAVAKLFTEEEAADAIDQLNRENPHARYLVVNL